MRKESVRRNFDERADWPCRKGIPSKQLKRPQHTNPATTYLLQEAKQTNKQNDHGIQVAKMCF